MNSAANLATTELVAELMARGFVCVAPRSPGTIRTKVPTSSVEVIDSEIAMIRTAKGDEVIIDAADAAVVANYSWLVSSRKSGGGVVAAVVFGRLTPLCKFLLGVDGSRLVDHENGDFLDNRRKNIRPATYTQNAGNTRIRRGLKAVPFKGVGRYQGSGRFRAYIYVGGRQQHLGIFDTAEAAASAYDAAARARFGQFACVNFPHPGEQSAHREAAAEVRGCAGVSHFMEADAA